jgi:hypothetical protein
MYMVITVHSYTELLVYSMVIDIEDSNLTLRQWDYQEDAIVT